MSIRRQRPSGRDTQHTYVSLACRIGTHATCEEAERKGPPPAKPLVYETCGCPCHEGGPTTSDKGEADG